MAIKPTGSALPLLIEEERPMKEVTFKRLKDDKPTKIMCDEVFDCISDDPEFIEEYIKENPPLCMLPHKDLNDMQIHKLVSESYVFLVEYEGEQRLAVAGGLYKNPQKAFDKIDPALMAKCNAAKKWVNGGKRDTPVFSGLREDPLCILLNDELESVRMEMLKSTWETIKVEHGTKTRDAIACVYMDPDYDPGPGRVISQHFQFGDPSVPTEV